MRLNAARTGTCLRGGGVPARFGAAGAWSEHRKCRAWYAATTYVSKRTVGFQPASWVVQQQLPAREAHYKKTRSTKHRRNFKAHMSGWCAIAFWRKAFLISAFVAPGCRPSTAYGSMAAVPLTRDRCAKRQRWRRRRRQGAGRPAVPCRWRSGPVERPTASPYTFQSLGQAAARSGARQRRSDLPAGGLGNGCKSGAAP